MTVQQPSSITPTYVGNGATTVFAYAFQIYQAADMVVTQTDLLGVETVLTLTTHYTLSGVGSPAGGNITLVTALPTGHTLVGRCILGLTQPTDLRNQGAYFAELHETVFDRLTKIAQQIDEKATRALSPVATVLNALAQVVSLYDQFDDRYLGSKAVAPTVNNDGNALLVGALYFDSAALRLKVWNGSAWITAVDVISGLVQPTLTNRTGVSLVAGDVVAIDAANNSSVVLSDVASSARQLVVSLGSIANLASGQFATVGGIPVTVKVSGTVTRGNYLVKSATTLVAADSGVAAANTGGPPPGAFAIAVSGGTGTVTAMMFGQTVGPALNSNGYGVHNTQAGGTPTGGADGDSWDIY